MIVAQVAQTAMGFVDTVMAGGYSATDMAAVAMEPQSGSRPFCLVTACCWR
ncbi:hypothetical protein ACVXG7_10780 [Enterobacter hormaechei]